jgi:TonB family protein
MASILVVGQEQRSLERFHRVLSAEGWRVRVAQGRAQALQAAALEPPDLVLAGAEMDGAEELAGAFRRSSGGPGIVVVMSEAGSPSGPAVLGDDRLRQPFADQDLVAAVRRMLAARTGAAGPVAQPVRLTSQEIFGDVLAEVEGQFGQPAASAAAQPIAAPAPPVTSPSPSVTAQGPRPSAAASRADSEIQRKLEKTLSGLMGGDPRHSRPAGTPAAAGPAGTGAAAASTHTGRRADAGGGAAEIEALLSKTLSELGTRPRHAAPAAAAASAAAAAPASPAATTSAAPSAAAPRPTATGSVAPSAAAASAAAASATAPSAAALPAAAASAAAPSAAASPSPGPSVQAFPASAASTPAAAAAAAAAAAGPAASPATPGGGSVPPSPSAPPAPTVAFDRRAVAAASPAPLASPPPAAAGRGLAAAPTMALPRPAPRESSVPPPGSPKATGGAHAADAAEAPTARAAGALTAPSLVPVAAPPAVSAAPAAAGGAPAAAPATPAATAAVPSPPAPPATVSTPPPSAPGDGTGVRRRMTGELDLSQIEELARTRRKVEPASRPGVAVPPAPADSPAATQRIQMVPRERPEPAGERFGQYTLLERIAVGGMAEVWKARMRGVEGFQKTVAIKKILPHMTDNADFVGMFIDEAKLAAQLSHPNIIHIYDLGKIGSDYYIAMEYVEGKDLRSLLNAARQRGKPLPLGLALLIAMRLASALDYAHRKRDFEGHVMGLVHRDVSPQNVLISFDGDVKLCDFGIAKAVSKVGQTQMGALKGKLQYMSPEQARGTLVDARSDIFSLGTVLFEMLTGQRLFDGDSEMSVLEAVRQVRVRSPRQVDPAVPREVDDLVMHALAGRPEDRFQTAGELEQRLEALLYAQKPSPSHGDLAAYVQRVLEPAGAPAAAAPAASASRPGRTAAPVPQTGVKAPSPAPATATATPLPAMPPLPQVAAAAAAPPHAAAAQATASPPAASPHEVAPLAPLGEVRMEEGSRRGRLLLAAAVVALVVAGLVAYLVASRRNAAGPGSAATPAGSAAAGSVAGGNAPGQAGAAGAGAAGKTGLPGAGGAIGASGAIGAGVAGAPGVPGKASPTAAGKVDIQGTVDQEVARRAEELKKKLEEQQKQLQKDLDKTKTAKADNAGGPAGSPASGAAKAGLAAPPLSPSTTAAAGEAGRGQQKPPVPPNSESRQAAAEPPAAVTGTATPPSPAAVAAEAGKERAAEPAAKPQPDAGAGSAVAAKERSAAAGGSGSAPAAASGPVVMPKLVSTPKPEYPPLARRLGVQGTVVLQVLVDEQGNVEDVQVLEPISQTVGINEAAVAVARGARYKPGTRNGDRVKMWTRLRVPFKL